MLCDNVETAVIGRDADGAGRHRFHPTLWDVARHRNFTPRLCRAYRGRTKALTP